MKKILCFILASVTLMFGLTSCSFGSNSGDSTSSTQEEKVIEFVQSELELEIGESVEAELIVSKKNVFVYWNVRDKEIASVSNKGVITALQPGETVVYAEFSGETAMCLVRVKEKSAVPELSVSIPYYDNKVSIYAGATLDLATVVKFGDATVTDATLEYAVADAQIASAEKDILTANAVGETTLTITATYNGQTATVKVFVQVINAVKAIKAVTVTGQKTSFKVGDKFVFDGVVDVEYVDGTTDAGVSYYTVDLSGFDATKTGTHTVVVKVGDVGYSYNVTVVKATTLKILMIGNSFSQDTVMWMPEIAKSLGFTEIKIATLAKGGCTLAMHREYLTNNSPEYELLYSDGNSWITETQYTMKDALRFADWDFVCLQQQSGNSGNVASYNSDLDTLIDYVKANTFKKDAIKLVWNMTWAYPTGSGWFGGLYDNDQMKMYNSIMSAVQEKIVTNDNFCLISPAGTAIQNGRTSYIGDYYPGEGEEFINTLDEWNRDGAHLSVYEGRFTSAMTMFCTVTGYTPDEISYNPANVDAIEAKVIRESVTNALANPFAVTASKY